MHCRSTSELKAKPEANFNIRVDMLKLALRIVEATGGRQGRQEDPKKERLCGLLERLLRTMDTGQGNQPPFHGTVEGFDTEGIIKNHKLRSS
eukprot:16109278-Heterocapsa_arctica.AAC.1